MVERKPRPGPLDALPPARSPRRCSMGERKRRPEPLEQFEPDPDSPFWQLAHEMDIDELANELGVELGDDEDD